MVIFRERYEGDAEQFESALHKAKKSIAEACEIFEDMKEQFSERGDYSGRYSSRYGERDGYSRRDEREWGEMQERRRSR